MLLFDCDIYWKQIQLLSVSYIKANIWSCLLIITPNRRLLLYLWATNLFEYVYLLWSLLFQIIYT
jgi:hypothetical protein